MTETNELKAAAKRLSSYLQREHGLSLKHGQALNAIAASRGEQDWHVRSAHAENRTVQDPVTPRRCLTAANNRQSKRFSMFIVAGPGCGKTWQVAEILLDELLDGKQVIIFDYGQVYHHLVQTLGGTEVRVQLDGNHSVTRWSNTVAAQNLVVFEFEECASGLLLALDLPAIAGIPFHPDNALVVVDGAGDVSSVFPACVELVSSFAKQGASVCVGSNDEADLDGFTSLPGQQIWMRLGRK